MGELNAYRCWPAWGDEGDGRTYYAETPGKARYACLRDLLEPCPDTAFTDVRSRLLGSAAGLLDPDLERLAASYGLPSLPLGTRAEHAGRPCRVAGCRDGYVVLRDEATGESLSDHVLDRKRYFLADGTVVDGEERAREIDADWERLNSSQRAG